MEMYQVIRYFLNEMEKKIWHALLTLVLFCLYISIFDVPFTIKNTFIGRLYECMKCESDFLFD